MTMQIKTIVLYNINGEKRLINFTLGSLNIISGASRTGKSTLIHIVDYCMGRSTFNIPEGIIRKTVAYYGVVFVLDDFELFVAKPKPPGNAQSSNQVYYSTGKNLEIPNINEIRPFTNDIALTDLLSRRIGIAENQAGEDTSNRRFEVTVDHTKFYLFQPANYITNPNVLFYRQDDEGLPKHIRTTLPFILGAIEDTNMQLTLELRERKQTLNNLRRQMAEIETSTEGGRYRGQSLLLEAAQAGIAGFKDIPNTFDEVLSLIKKVVAYWQSEDNQLQVANHHTLSLNQQAANIRERIYEKQREIDATREFIQRADGYVGEASQQMVRLSSIGLFEDEDSPQNHNGNQPTCPLCLSTLNQPTAPVTAIRSQLDKLEADLQHVGREQPRLDSYLSRLNRELENLQEERRQVQLAIQALTNLQEHVHSVQDDRLRNALVVGRMTLFLDTTPQTSTEIIMLRQEIQQLENEIEGLEQQIDMVATEEKLTSILDNINSEMTRLARTLQLEHQYPYRLDPKRLTVSISNPKNPIVMGRNLGSGSNFLGVHLITFLALHNYFVRESRPVPNFIILDQPSQVYFPRQAYMDESGNLQEPEDLESVQRMFDLLFDYCKDLYPSLQIIVLEHAEFDNEQFQSALIEQPWRDDRALIPTSWIEDEMT